VIGHDPECLENLEKARRLIVAATERLMQQPVEPVALAAHPQGAQTEMSSTLADVEREAIVAAYQRPNRKPLKAARLLGIGRSTLYRRLREIRKMAA
jgi:transcriptional regulator of acetoin/glycerol metabolism